MRTRFSIPFLVFLISLLGWSQERRFIQPNSAMEPTVLERATSL